LHAEEWIVSSRSLSSGAHSRDRLAPRNDAPKPFVFIVRRASSRVSNHKGTDAASLIDLPGGRTDLPDGHACKKAVQSASQKYSLFSFDPNHLHIFRIPAQHRGAFRDRHERRAGDAMDAVALLTKAFLADGEVVWS
jgi:hypothetical protein